MSEENPTEQVQEDIHHHAHGTSEKWIGWAALTAALFAALAAICGSLASNRQTESTRELIEANDLWGQYQAKSIKANVLQTKIDLLTAFEKPVPHNAAEKRAEYDKEMAEIRKDAEHARDSSKVNLRIHESTERGVTLLHIAIAVVAISVLTRRKPFWVLSMIFGLAGIAFAIQGLLQHS
ncbi:MAG: DUF4337 domain-containing protein [Tepidisphaeraceae bacterium]|jgi:hypothetical protein